MKALNMPWDIRLRLCKNAKEIDQWTEEYVYNMWPSLYWGLEGAHDRYPPDAWFYFVPSREAMGANIVPVVYWGA